MMRWSWENNTNLIINSFYTLQINALTAKIEEVITFFGHWSSCLCMCSWFLCMTACPYFIFNLIWQTVKINCFKPTINAILFSHHSLIWCTLTESSGLISFISLIFCGETEMESHGYIIITFYLISYTVDLSATTNLIFNFTL